MAKQEASKLTLCYAVPPPPPHNAALFVRRNSCLQNDFRTYDVRTKFVAPPKFSGQKSFRFNSIFKLSSKIRSNRTSTQRSREIPTNDKKERRFAGICWKRVILQPKNTIPPVQSNFVDTLLKFLLCEWIKLVSLQAAQLGFFFQLVEAKMWLLEGPN